MATVTRTPAPAELPVAVQRLYPISLDLCMAMGRNGLLTPRDRVVLIAGFLVNKRIKGTRHIHVVQLAVDALGDGGLTGVYVRKEDPIALPATRPGDRDSAPEPDVALVRGCRDDYADRLPGPEDVILLIEVADSSLADDRKMLVQYARSGIPYVWLVNLNNDTIEVYHTPSTDADNPRYGDREVKGINDSIEIEADGQVIGRVAVADLIA